MSGAHIGSTAKVKSSNVDSCELNPTSECIGYIEGQNRASEVFGKHDENYNEDKRAFGGLVESTLRRYSKNESRWGKDRRDAAAADGGKKRCLISDIHSLATRWGIFHFG